MPNPIPSGLSNSSQIKNHFQNGNKPSEHDFSQLIANAQGLNVSLDTTPELTFDQNRASLSLDIGLSLDNTGPLALKVKPNSGLSIDANVLDFNTLGN